MITYHDISANGVEQADDSGLFADPPPAAFPASTVTIAAVSPEGFPITIALNDPAPGALGNWMKLLRDKGYTPPAAPRAEHTPAQPGQVSDTAGIPPSCPKHNKVMRTSQYGGFFCTAADPDAPNGKCTYKVK